MANPENNYGFVYAATGDAVYIELAIRSAITLREYYPEAQIDLYTDQPLDAEVFDQIHVLTDSWFRAKLDALIESRFDRTIYVDADTFLVDDISDIFDVLDRFDLATTHDQGRASPAGLSVYKREFSQAYPQFNGGLIGIKRSEKTTEFLTAWKRLLIESKHNKDQPLFRELIWEGDLRIATLPPEYNLMHLAYIDVMNVRRGTPKLLHSPQLYYHVKHKNAKEIRSLLDLLGVRRLSKLLKLQKKHAKVFPDHKRKNAKVLIDSQFLVGTSLKDKIVKKLLKVYIGK